MERQVFFLDLRDEATGPIYDAWHRPGKVPQAVLADIRAAGILEMDIFRSGSRLVMLTRSNGDPGNRISSLASAEWEAAMAAFQQPLPWAPPGTKWLGAERIFDLHDHLALGKHS